MPTTKSIFDEIDEEEEARAIAEAEADVAAGRVAPGLESKGRVMPPTAR